VWYKKAAGRVGKRGRGGERRKEIEVKEGKREREREKNHSVGLVWSTDRHTHTDWTECADYHIPILGISYHFVSYHYRNKW